MEILLIIMLMINLCQVKKKIKIDNDLNETKTRIPLIKRQINCDFPSEAYSSYTSPIRTCNNNNNNSKEVEDIFSILDLKCLKDKKYQEELISKPVPNGSALKSKKSCKKNRKVSFDKVNENIFAQRAGKYSCGVARGGCSLHLGKHINNTVYNIDKYENIKQAKRNNNNNNKDGSPNRLNFEERVLKINDEYRQLSIHNYYLLTYLLTFFLPISEYPPVKVSTPSTVPVQKQI